MMRRTDMKELEKILEEIKAKSEIVMLANTRHYEVVGMGTVEEIIRKHLSRENDPEITRSSRDSIYGECSRRKWYQIGYRDGKNDGWIPVEERLPANNEDVLVTTDVGLITFGYVSHGKWITDQEPDYPIAWRPLPESYRPERRKK